MIRIQRRFSAGLAALCLTASAGCVSGKVAGQTPVTPSIGASGSVVTVGLTTDLPGWGVLQPGTNSRSGFDYDLMNWLSDQMHFTPSVVDVTLEQRIPAMQKGAVRLMLANFSMTDERRKYVSFAGPYVITQQGVMVRKGDNRIQDVRDLAGRIVCTASGTTSLDQLNGGSLQHQIVIVEHLGFQECVDDLERRKVDAVSTDQLGLLGFQQVNAGLQIQNFVFGAQDRYGIGLPLGDVQDCNIFTAQLRTFISSGAWDTFFGKYFPNEPSQEHRPDPNMLTPCQ